MKVFIDDPGLCAEVSLVGLKGRTVEIQSTTNKHHEGTVKGIGAHELLIAVTDSVPLQIEYQAIERIRVTG